MSRLANIKPKDAVQAFQKAGFEKRHQTGSHLIMKNYTTGKMISAPIHPRDIKIGLLQSLIKRAGLTVKEFLELL